MATNFGTKLTTTRPPVKDNCALFAPTLLYAAKLHSVAMGQIPRSTERMSIFLFNFNFNCSVF